MSGGGSSILGLDALIQERLQLDTVVFNPFSGPFFFRFLGPQQPPFRGPFFFPFPTMEIEKQWTSWKWKKNAQGVSHVN